VADKDKQKHEVLKVKKKKKKKKKKKINQDDKPGAGLVAQTKLSTEKIR